MSESKEKAGDQRRPKCCLCRNHGLIVAKKGHLSCPFLGCPCQKCAVIARRRGAVAYRKNLNKVRSEVQKLAARGGIGVVDLTTNRPLTEGTVASAAPGSPGASRTPTDGGGAPSSGLESGEQPPPARNSSGFDLERTGHLPLIPFPFVDSNICPQRFPVRGQYLPNMPWMPPPPPPPPPAGWQPAMHYAAQTPLAYTTNYRHYFYGLPPFPQPGTLRRLLPTRQQWPLPTRQQPQHLPQNNQQATGK